MFTKQEKYGTCLFELNAKNGAKRSCSRWTAALFLSAFF